MRSVGPTTFIALGICLLVGACVGIAAAVVLSLIPTYTSTKDVTVAGEKYCLSKLQMFVTVNPATTTGYPTFLVNSSYPLSLACYRILQNTKSDSQLQACLVSDCVFNNVTTNPINMTCAAVIYYSVRCSDQSSSSGLNNYVSSSGNSACRKTRMTTINSALGSSSSTYYTNVPSLTLSNTTVTVYNITTSAYSNYTQLGVTYCGGVSQTAITSAVNAQSSG